MLTSNDLLFMCGVTEVPNNENIESVLLAVNCELLTCSVTKQGVYIDGIISFSTVSCDLVTGTM